MSAPSPLRTGRVSFPTRLRPLLRLPACDIAVRFLDGYVACLIPKDLTLIGTRVSATRVLKG
ncbi:MAG: hypothetical protein DRI57_12210 [Deltaproteobacteria bacterium]|nr:MAG: hypothetical protein DRI57_12210 [Deltaproteobacteria bacterium]